MSNTDTVEKELEAQHENLLAIAKELDVDMSKVGGARSESEILLLGAFAGESAAKAAAEKNPDDYGEMLQQNTELTAEIAAALGVEDAEINNAEEKLAALSETLG